MRNSCAVADIRALTDADRDLIALAKDIVDRHGDDSVSTMGAAVRDTEGRMYGAINLYHFTGGPCAELVALGVSVAQGAGPLDAIVAVGDGGRGPVGPCGRCRQVLFDYHPNVRVLLPTDVGIESVMSVAIADLLPFGGRWDVETGTQPYEPS